MKNIIKNNLLGFVLGLIVASGIGVVAGAILATDITYTKEDKTTVTVQKAIDELYKNADNLFTCSNVICSIGNATGATIEPKTGSETYEAVVYLDPTDLTKTCNATNSTSNFGKTNQKTGCMRWYAYNVKEVDEKKVYDLILDHNSTAKVPWANQTDYIASGGTAADWSAEKYNTQGPVTVNKELKKLVSESGWVVIPRMITADEIAHIVGADREDTLNWKSSNAYGTDVANNQSSWFYLDGGRNTNKTSYSETDGWGKQFATTPGSSNYAWLYNYTYRCTGWTTEYGCNVADTNTWGYWTSSKSSVFSSAYYIHQTGTLSAISKAYNDGYGLRPVITIIK